MRNERIERIGLDMSGRDMVVALSDGNPGAITVCIQLFNQGAAIDPDSWLGPVTGLISLDTHAIYGSRIWMLYKDVCREDLVSMIGVLRAVQMGHLSEHALHRAIDGDTAAFNVADELAWVREQLPRFGLPTKPAEAPTPSVGEEAAP